MALTDLEKRVIEERGTEPRYSSDLLELDEKGVYRCKRCGQELFDSGEKYDAGTGWPSFRQAKKNAVKLRKDERHRMERTEAVCSSCGAHLGHVFEEENRERYCINGVALEFEGDG